MIPSGDINRRILALDIRPRSFGFVVLEGPDQLLDWGARSYRKEERSRRREAAIKVATLLEDYVPALVVIEEPPRKQNSVSKKLRQIISAIAKEVKSHRTPVRTISRRAVVSPFDNAGRKTKHERASYLAKRFPDLAWKLPPRRKPWESEDYRMSIFDAATFGVAYYSSQSTHARGKQS